MKHVDIWTDGACSGNPGIGGWGAILRYKDSEKSIQGAAASTTNNIMEMKAVIEALKLLKEPCEVDLTSDSQYVIKGATQWMQGWKANGWRTKDKKAVKNSGLWQDIEMLNRMHKITWHWIKGHAGHPENEECDRLAREAIADQREALR
ncbi:MAG: ribonuclease HI [Alphaproteobacteria bacterium]|nr:ribonuclease HI [Alphaproteobacteria bacterium]